MSFLDMRGPNWAMWEFRHPLVATTRVRPGDGMLGPISPTAGDVGPQGPAPYTFSCPALLDGPLYNAAIRPYRLRPDALLEGGRAKRLSSC